ncbi:LOW QUALITY PROTEIN: uncharacterized protein LOC124498650 [Dermatophagoides farinae]|uniref:LOW QUALITY PROTEIN: uncharacterized protein LOC124498650 n=1 Tax=Dermatophagoides farinae TaxID=6954 RepID=UPI003F60ED90
MINIEKLEKKWKLLGDEAPRIKGPITHFNPLLEPPDWYDVERFKRSQKLARKYFLSLNIAHFIGNILLIHLPDVLVPVIATGNSSTPFRVFMRILSTVIHILSWYDEDPFDATTKTHQSMITVRRNCHMAVSRLMNNKYPRPNRYWLSQFDMAMTQWSLIGIVGIRPNQCAFFGTTEKEFEEYFYFWRVIGYCVGIEDRFNICFGVEGYEETREFLDICFQRCYKVHLDKQSAPVVMGMNLTEGVFLALEGAAPRFLICYESFMKYWYDTLGVRHPIKLDTFERKLNYAIFIFVMEYVLRIRLFYIIFSWLFFYLQQRLFGQIEQVRKHCEQHYVNIKYQLDSEYFDYNDQQQQQQQQRNHMDLDINENPIDSIDDESCKKESISDKKYYEIDNYFYRPNVKE